MEIGQVEFEPGMSGALDRIRCRSRSSEFVSVHSSTERRECASHKNETMKFKFNLVASYISTTY